MKINWDDIFSQIYFLLLMISVGLIMTTPLWVIHWFIEELSNG